MGSIPTRADGVSFLLLPPTAFVQWVAEDTAVDRLGDFRFHRSVVIAQGAVNSKVAGLNPAGGAIGEVVS